VKRKIPLSGHEEYIGSGILGISDWQCVAASTYPWKIRDMFSNCGDSKSK